MHIFADEREIADKIKNNSFAYITAIQKDGFGCIDADEMRLSFIDQKIRESNDHIVASLKDDELYYHTAILVTSNWNKNDDVFRPETIWAAKNTPVHKPTNDGHDSMKILGHMVKSWAVDDSGAILSDNYNKDDLPKKFHILVGSVIYKVWPSCEDQEKYVEELIEKIEAGEKYVSMECTFQNFDYALASDDGLTFVERNKDTAFLSKYLRAYGGDGIYNGTKIGRAVKEISFCGKGYVDKPANPESIIFTKNDISDFSKAETLKNISKENFNLKNCGVILSNDVENKMEKQMTDFYKEQVDELKSVNTTLAKSLDDLKEKLAASNVSKLEDEIKTLKAQVNDMSEVLTKRSDEINSTKAAVEVANTQVADLTKANEALTKTNTELSDKIKAIEVEKTTVARVSTLVSGGFSKEEADAKVAIFASLDDAQFEAIAKELTEAKKFVKPEPKDDKKKEDKKDEENPGKADADDLENADEPKDEVASAGASDGDFDITELSGKLSAALKTKDVNGDK